MGKFKVGQKVRFKTREELIKIYCFDSWPPKYKTLAGKVVKIYDFGSSRDCYIIQDEQEILKLYFSECCFEDLDVLVET